MSIRKPYTVLGGAAKAFRFDAVAAVRGEYPKPAASLLSSLP
jgi:hypothetical protein